MEFRKDGVLYRSYEEYDLDQYLADQEEKQRKIRLHAAINKYIQVQRSKGTLRYKP